MPIEAADKYLPNDPSIKSAFDRVTGIYPNVGSTVEEPLEHLQRAASDYFTAGVAYLANHGHDEYIQEIGTTMWWAVNRRQVIPAMTDNIFGSAIQFGVPIDQAINHYSNNSEPHVLFKVQNRGIEQIETAFVLLPFEFIYMAKSKPIESLARFTWIGSQVRDMVNGRVTIDQHNINRRALATEAHFLHEAVKRHPETKLPEFFKKLMREFPRGVDSLAQNLLYEGMTSDGSQPTMYN